MHRTLPRFQHSASKGEQRGYKKTADSIVQHHGHSGTGQNHSQQSAVSTCQLLHGTSFTATVLPPLPLHRCRPRPVLSTCSSFVRHPPLPPPLPFGLLRPLPALRPIRMSCGRVRPRAEPSGTFRLASRSRRFDKASGRVPGPRPRGPERSVQNDEDVNVRQNISDRLILS